jgi:RHS repeat-associated protein/uncharacterized repeat protein (TIGR01451 family)
MMQSHAPASTRKPAGYFHRNGLLSQLMSVLLAWTMVMSSLPVYATDQPHAEWVHSLDVDSITKPTESAQHRSDPATVARRTTAKTVASPRLATSPMVAALHPPVLPGSVAGGQGSDLFLNAFSGGLFALPLQAQDSPLEVSVGFADNSSASANFPEPWNEANPLVNFVGSGTVYHAGAIRLDNPGSLPVTVDSVKVDLARPGPVFQLWQNIVVPAGGSTILTQTQDGNFNTSASSIVGCGLPLAPDETRIPKITITVAGTSTDYDDTAHVLDTGGFDSSCRGNQSLQWRSIGTAGPENPAGSIQLISDGAPHAVGTQDTLTVQVEDAGNVPLANAPVTLSVLNGPNAGKTFSGTTDASGSASIAYSSTLQGTDLITATVKNASNGVMQSQQASTTWSSADVCVAPAAPNAAASRLIYVGQNSISFGGVLRLAAFLTDGTGNPLSGRQLSFAFAGQTVIATTDANGTATVSASALPVGASAVSISYSGDANFQAAQLSTTVNVVTAATLLRYTGTNLITALGQQTVSAVLTNLLGTTPVAGRTLMFTLNGVSASAITGTNGAATATLNFATALPTGAGQLQINFAGDSSYQASSRAVPIQIYQPMPFVIWGGNSGGLRIGQRVNFWGSQWESQVINGQYFGANPSFKGWSGSVASFNQCEANATLATLDMACWQVKPGQSFPPNQVLPTYIEVVVSTVIDKSGDTVFGNIACGAILQVDHTPPYGAVPGQDGFGTIAAVNGDCGGIFPRPAVLAASQQQKSLVLPAENISVNYSIANQGTTDATSVVLNENFDQVTPATGSANLGTIAAGLSASGNFPVAIPAISPRQGTETSVDYSSRLAAQDGRLFTSEGEISFSDPFSQLYTPLDISSFSQLTLPRLTVGVSGPTCIAPSSTLPYQVTVENVGSNTATHIAATLTLPDSSTASPLVADLTAGTRFVGTVNWHAPGIAAKSPTETTDAYLARLHANDGTTLPAAVLSALWQDTLSGAYGPVEQPFVTLTQRIPVVSTTTPATQALLPNQKTQLSFGVSNTGTGNAVQVTLRIKRQDGTFINVPNFSLPGGQSATTTANYQAPALAPKGVAESDTDYISRLQALNNSSLNLNAILNWTDPAQNIYGPTDNPFTATEQLPILSVALSAPAAANSGDSISYTVTLTNVGQAPATVGLISITLPDGSVQHPAPLSNTVASGASTTASVSYAIPANHATGDISATATAAWSDSVSNSYGPLSASASTHVTLPNLAPVVSAGANQTVPFPNTFPLQGTVTDDGKPVGGQLTSTWTQVSGPAPAVFADPHNPQTTVQLNAQGTYVLKLTGDDSQLQTSAQVSITTTPGNTAPVVTVGPDQSIQLPTNAANLIGSATDDGLPAGSSITYLWKEVTGPGTATFGTPTAPNTTATFPAIGVYLLRLTASDSQLTGSADLRITVLPHNNPPTANAGPPQTLFQPVNSANLQGVISDDGLPTGGTLTASWSVVSGPGIVTFANPGSATTAASFSTIGVYVLRLTASDSQLSAQADTTVTVKPANLPPVVNAGPLQTMILPSNVNTLPLFPTLIPISTGFNSPIAADYHQPTNKVVMSVNYFSGQPHNFELVAQDGSRTQFSNVAGLTDEVYIATARDEIGGKSIGGFLAGEMFTGSGVGGVIVRISPDGTTVRNPWVQLPGEGGLLRGQLYIDRTGVFGGDLIVATTTGNIWRVTSAGVPTKLASVGVPPEGLITLPTDQLHYGPFAGKIVTGSENSTLIFMIDPQGVLTSFDLGIAAEHIKLVNPNENFFGVDFGSSRLLGIPAAELAGMVGDLIIGEESPGNLWQIHWNGTRFEGTKFARVSQWEGATMAPAGIVQVNSTTASVTLNGTVSDDGLPAGGALTSVWTKVSGPGTTTFTSPNTPITSVSFSVPGTYVLRLTASDSELTSSSDVTVVISANAPPVVSAGPSKEITTPDPVSLQGAVTDDGLPAGGTLSTFWTKAIGPGSVQFTTPSFDATDNFSTTTNPSGPWTYGSTPTRGGTFTPYAFTGQFAGMPGWFKTAQGQVATAPLLVYNNTGVSVVSGGLNIPPATLLLHPGTSGENSVIRFTAPATASYLVQGRFYGVDNTTTDVSVLLNSTTTLLSGNITERNLGVPFTFARALNAGDKLDFSVGFGNGNNSGDSTGMQLVITQAGDASTSATFTSPGDYILRLSASDSQLFAFNDTHVHVNAQCVPTASGLVGWWPGDGDARDLALGNTGVIEDGVTFTPAMVGKGFTLNGGAADVVAPASTALNVSSFTMAAWVFPQDLGTARPILEYSTSTGSFGVHLWENLNSSVQVSPGSLYANIVDTSGSSHVMATNGVGGSALQLKRWNHVALTYDRATGIARMFVNGAFAAASTLGIFTPRTALPLYIGARPTSTHFLGSIDEPQIDNRALSPNEIQAIFTAGSAGNCKPTGPQPPVVSAGLNQTISLPVTQVNLNGSATDPGGAQLSIQWSVTSGTGNVVFGNASSPTTTATFSAPGVYVLRLTASNNQSTAFSEVTITLLAPVNKAPQVSAGQNQTIQFPQSSITLNGAVTDDGLPVGSTVTQQWSRFSGPAPVTFTNPTQAVTQATFSTPGTYTLQLTTTDSEFTVSAQVTITVLAAPTPNQSPAISVTADNVNLTLPANVVNLTGTITDDGQPAGSTVTAQWSQVSGPAPATFSSPNTASTKATFSVAGSYVLKLTASDSQLSNSVSVPITVNPQAPNQAPSVTVIASQNAITLPSNTLSLTGKITDDGLPVGGKITFQWSALSGPAPVTFSNPAGGSTQAVFTLAGTYVLQLAASDSQLTGTGSVSITVNPAGTNQPPVVSITADNTAITLPANKVTLTGTITDDGLPTGAISTQWSQVSGPAGATITQLTQTSVKVTFTTAGAYTFKLTASDGQFSSSATINITVTTAGGNQPPAVTGGPNQTITLPQSTIALRGDARDDGLPAGSTLTVSWSALSGPAPVVFSDPNSLITQATFGAAGVYVLQLLASDTQLQSTAQVTITVLSSVAPPPPPPVVSVAGLPDGQEITKPTPIVGSVTTGTWKLEYSLLDGNGNPTTFTTFASGTAPVVNATLGTFDPTVLLNGQYLVRFSSTDNAGQTASTSSTVDVSRNTKVGNFTLSFNDLNVPLPGLPITVTRTYDSRDKRVGDFGVGWTLSIANVRVQKTGGAIGTGWEETQQWRGFFPTYCLQPVKNHTVSVTFPDGKVYKFQTVNTPQCQQFVPITAPQIGFTQIGTGSATAGATLTPIGDTDLLLDGGVPGPVNLINFEVEFADFTQYQLTTAEGYTYILDQKLGATRVTDRNSNTLTISSAGVISSTGQSVSFTRDTLGRITQISDLNSAAIHYQYSAAGDLNSVTDRANLITTFTYDNHFLTNVIDPRGLTAVKNVYDDGRLVSTTDASGNTINYAPDLAAQHETIRDRLGNPTTFEYDGDGNVTRVTDALGGVITSTFDANSNKLTETSVLGKTVTNTYDAVGNLLTETDPLGHVSRYTYNAFRQVLSFTDPQGHTALNTYDARGNLLTQKDALGNTTVYTYNNQGRPLTIKDAAGNTSSYVYDGNGRMTQQTDGLGNITTFTYDGNGNRLSQTATRTKSDSTTESLTTQYQYDADNRLLQTTYPDLTTTRTVYNALGKPADIFDALNRKTHFDYDDNGRLIKTTYPDQTFESITYDANDRRLTSVDRANRTTSYTYDALGRLTRTTYPDQSSSQAIYDALGQQVQSIDALNHVTSYGYDDLGRRISVTDALNHTTNFAYDAAGNQISMTDALNHTTQFVYDAANRLLSTTHPDQTTDSSTYDGLGRRVSKTDQAGKVTQYGYDALGRLISVTQFLNGQPLTTRYAYDEVGNRISQTDANGHKTSYSYDKLGRRKSRTLPIGMSESYVYDAAGNMTSKADFKGRTTTYQYDTMNRLLSKTADTFFSTGACAANACGATQVSFTYSATGRRLSMTDASGLTNYTYDARDQLLTRATPFGTVTYAYDEAGNTVSLSSSNTGGASMTYGYDALNRLSTVTDAGGATSYSYDAVGNLAGYAYANGVSTSYSYDPLNRLTQMQSTCTSGPGCGTPGAPVARYAYTLNAAGHRLSIAELSGRTVQYAYDDLYRLTSETISGAASQNGTVSYTYDAVGNRLRRSSTLPAIPATGLLNYDNNDRPATDPYDNNGNLLNGGVGSNVYDFENRLVQAGGVTIVYDGDGNRVQESVAGVSTSFLVADKNPSGYPRVLDEIQGSSVTRTYTYGLDLINERQNLAGTLTTSFYGFDGHGSVRFLTDSTGATTDTYDYDSFGNLISKTGATPNNYLFAGEQFDTALGIYYNRARYYDQRQGRFWTMDTMEGEDSSPASLHKYLYAAANPVSYNDPSGYAYVSNWLFGGIVHRNLGALYVAQTGGCSDTQMIRLIAGMCDNRIVGLSAPYGYRPDLANPFPGKGDIFEIKPINSAADAIPQLLGYLAFLRLADNRVNAPRWHLGSGSEFSYPNVMPLNAVTVAYIAPPVFGAIIYYVVGVDDVLGAAALGAVAITGALGAGNVAAATAANASNVLSIGSAVRLVNAAEAAASAEIEADIGLAIELDLAA